MSGEMQRILPIYAFFNLNQLELCLISSWKLFEWKGLKGINCTCADLTTVAQNIINLSIFVAIFLSAILFAWAGWKMISGRSMGSHGAIDEGKEVLWNVVIGLVIIIAAWLIVDTIVKTITASGTVKGVWNSICPSR
jgi:hypothetical protein